MSKTKVVVLPQSRQRTIIYSSYQNIPFLSGKYISVQQKYIQYFHLLTHAEYIYKYGFNFAI